MPDRRMLAKRQKEEPPESRTQNSCLEGNFGAARGFGDGCDRTDQELDQKPDPKPDQKQVAASFHKSVNIS